MHAIARIARIARFSVGRALPGLGSRRLVRLVGHVGEPEARPRANLDPLKLRPNVLSDERLVNDHVPGVEAVATTTAHPARACHAAPLARASAIVRSTSR